ncbi:MAG TPA: helical backbone metal receptor [Longimicrobium sp.]|nr:helical backbone metal receptor [Longimicrobium sp.]
MRLLLHAGLAVLLGVLAGCTEKPPPAPSATRRVVSLSPGLTETLFALGAGDQVVGVSDFTDWPEEATRRPKVGTTLSPHFEAIARLRPTVIVDEQVKQAPKESLASLAPVKVLPWLSLDDVVASTRELGRLSGREAEAEALAQRFASTLSRQAPEGAPRVLLAIADSPGPLSTVWYIKRDSLHGAALEAAGARNAVGAEVTGPPNLSLEGIIQLDPDAILVLVPEEALDEAGKARYLEGWRRLTVLRAVKGDRVRLVVGRGSQSTGPRILRLVEQLRAALGSLPPPP